MTALAVGIDVGGTKVAGGVVDADGQIRRRARRPTPSSSARDTHRVIVELVEELVGASTADGEVVAVGVGAAGWVDSGRSRVIYAPNLAWRDEPLRESISTAVGLPVVIENDANSAAWAEHRYGVARDLADFVLITSGTGIGTGLVIGGEVCRGGFGIAGEAGHMTVVRDGLPCRCGQRGCWEQYASGRALVALARERAAAEPSRAARLLGLVGGDVDAIEGPLVTAAAEQGDPVARECFGEVGRWLGEGMAMLAAVLDPSGFVVGGGVADAGDLLLDPAVSAFELRLSGGSHRPHASVRVAATGNDAGLIGAADLARIEAAAT